MFYNSKTTWGIDMKPWSSQQAFLRNGLRSKLHPSLALVHVQITYFETQTLQNKFLRYYNDFLVSQVKDILWHLSFSRSPCFSGQQIIHHSREPVNYFIKPHHFTIGIAGTDFKYIPCLEFEILGGKAHIFLIY